MRESAVVAYVPAELRERDENFPGIRNQVSMPGVAQTRSHRQQRLEVLLFRERHHVQVLGQLAVECHLKNRLRHLPHSENSLSNRLRFATHRFATRSEPRGSARNTFSYTSRST